MCTNAFVPGASLAKSSDAAVGQRGKAKRGLSGQRGFERLQRGLRHRGPLYRQRSGSDLPRTMLVWPSYGLDVEELQKVVDASAQSVGGLAGNRRPAGSSLMDVYLERYLFNILHLGKPWMRVRLPLPRRPDPAVLNYYLDLVPRQPFARRPRRRLEIVEVGSMGLASLTQHVLANRWRLLPRIASGLDPGRTHAYPFNVTTDDVKLFTMLGVPVLGSSPRLAPYGTKAGGRRLFARLGVPHPEGIGEVHSVEALVAGLARFVVMHPDARRMVVKLNEGFSGEGNAILDLQGLSASRADQLPGLIIGRLQRMRFAAKGESWAHFSKQIAKLGAIAERFVEGEVKSSPSVQVYIGPDGKVEILSTYEQILGGEDGQVFLGASSPANDDYRKELHLHGLRIGKQLAREGAIGRFAVDFIAARDGRGRGGAPGPWTLEALEINLRAGGTTHPTNTVKLLVDGQYDLRSGAIVSGRTKRRRYHTAHDNVEQVIGDALLGLTPAQVIAAVKRAGLHYDRHRERGVVLHMLSGVTHYGKLGFTAIDDSPRSAEGLSGRLLETLRQVRPSSR